MLHENIVMKSGVERAQHRRSTIMQRHCDIHPMSMKRPSNVLWTSCAESFNFSNQSNHLMSTKTKEAIYIGITSLPFDLIKMKIFFRWALS